MKYPLLAAALLAFAVSACNDQQEAPPPAPMIDDAVAVPAEQPPVPVEEAPIVAPMDEPPPAVDVAPPPVEEPPAPAPEVK